MALVAVSLKTPREGRLVTVRKMLEDPRRGDARQIRSAGGGRQGEAKADEVMGWIANDGLIKIADLNSDSAPGVRQRAQVADMAVAADPDRRPFRDLTGAFLQPFVEFDRRAAHIGMGGPRHLQIAFGDQGSGRAEGAAASTPPALAVLGDIGLRVLVDSSDADDMIGFKRGKSHCQIVANIERRMAAEVR
jgi:hypothetical protein